MKVFLVGMRGSGKTTVGRALARRLRLPFVDADALLGRLAGRSAARVLAEDGERVFRRLEARVLERICGGPDAVVATGGGVVLRAGNRALMRRHGVVVYLRARPSVLARRIRRQGLGRRPSLTGRPADEEVGKVLRAREPLYRAAAHFVVVVDRRSPFSIARSIARARGGGAP